ncbi:hypothetical protein [Actinoplanes regularis]|uniref:hypothetical protein n=1 Tax=Actinoplanes regularis TaxID=52697 RepID=UPI0011780DC3|nr:hypothetical protein [Actinoplanes regularis]
MPDDNAHGHQIRIVGCADTDAALSLQQPLARLLCPDESHPPPCPVPWDFSVTDDKSGRIVLLLLLWTTGDTAAEAAGRIQAHVGPRLTVSVAPGAGEMFDTVAEQYRIERSPH